MGVDAWALIISIVAAIMAIVGGTLANRQAHSAEDSAASAVRAADAANEQVAVARDQLDLAARIRREQNEPYVVVDIRPAPWETFFLLIIIENIGPTVARNVRFRWTPEIATTIEQQLGKTLREARIFTHGIPMLPPGRRIEILFDKGDLFHSNLPKHYTVQVDAEGHEGKVETMTYEIDLNILVGYNLLGQKTAHDAVGELKKLRETAQKIEKRLDDLNS